MSSKKLRASITGVHGYVPDYILSNSELETLVDTTDEWIMTRTGIKERRILKGDLQGTSVLGIKCVKGLLEKTNTDPKDIDLIICATVTPDMFFPSTSNLIADKVTLGGLVKGEVAANTLNVASTARIEGNLKTNSLSIDLGAEVAGNISRIS